MRGCNVARGPAAYTGYDDLDLISRSQVCQNHRLQIAFRFLSAVVNGACLPTHIEKVKHSMLCVAGVYLRDIAIIRFL